MLRLIESFSPHATCLIGFSLRFHRSKKRFRAVMKRQRHVFFICTTCCHPTSTARLTGGHFSIASYFRNAALNARPPYRARRTYNWHCMSFRSSNINKVKEASSIFVRLEGFLKDHEDSRTLWLHFNLSREKCSDIERASSCTISTVSYKQQWLY